MSTTGESERPQPGMASSPAVEAGWRDAAAEPAGTDAPHTVARWVLLAALGLAVVFQLGAIVTQSLTEDEPYHLLAGYQALRYGRNTLNLEHPPLVKMLAAAPLVLEREPLAPPLQVGSWPSELAPHLWRSPERVREARVTTRPVLFAVVFLPLVAAWYFLGRRLAGPLGGLTLAAMFSLSFDALPFLSLSQTDGMVTLGFCLSGLARDRFIRNPSWRTSVLFGLAVGLAVAAKFSGLLVLPIVVAALALVPAAQWPMRRRAAAALLVGGTAAAAAMAPYTIANRHLSAGEGRETIERYCAGRGTLVTANDLQPFRERLLAVARVSPSLAQWLTGLLGIDARNRRGVYAALAFGHLSTRGWWWYFPALLLVKTPLPILAASIAAALAWLRRRTGERLGRRAAARLPAIAGLQVVVYLAVAMSSSYNIGIRHMLPVLPFLLLPAALVLATRPRWAIAVVLSLAVESAALCPTWMAATNTWWLGSANPGKVRYGSELAKAADLWRPTYEAATSGEDHGVIAATFRLYFLPVAVTPRSVNGG